MTQTPNIFMATPVDQANIYEIGVLRYRIETLDDSVVKSIGQKYLSKSKPDFKHLSKSKKYSLQILLQ